MSKWLGDHSTLASVTLIIMGLANVVIELLLPFEKVQEI